MRLRDEWLETFTLKLSPILWNPAQVLLTPRMGSANHFKKEGGDQMRFGLIVALAALFGIPATSACAQPPAEFFRSKTIKLMVFFCCSKNFLFYGKMQVILIVHRHRYGVKLFR